MTSEVFNMLVQRVQARQNVLLHRKGADYMRGDEDRLANFKRVAEAIGVTPLHAWYIYAAKHWDAITQFIRTGRLESEGIVGRFDDLMNYLLLGLALITDEQFSSDKIVGETNKQFAESPNGTGQL